MLPYDGTADCLECHDGTPYPDEYKQDRLPALLSLLNKIADTNGQFQVISGYRTPEYNQSLAANSQAHQVVSSSYHIQGMAADIRPVTGTVEELHQSILSMHSFGELPELGGIGVYPISRWVHVDTGKAHDGHLRRWTGS